MLACQRRRPLRVAGALGLALLVALTPLALALNSAYFADVTNPPYDDEMVTAIDAIKTAGITVGCTPTTYCPEGVVSRWQMALFLARGLGLKGAPAPNTYVSKAKTVDATGALSGTVLTANGTGAASFQPLPPANATIGASVSRNTNSPVGRITSILSPGASASFIQLDMRPPGTRLTVVVNGSPTSGELDIE